MNDYIRIGLESIISSSIVLIILRLIGEGWINLVFQKRLKKFDADIAKDLASFNSRLDYSTRRIQAQIDVQLEQLRIQYTNVFSKQLDVFKEVCKQLNSVYNLYNRIRSFYTYDCKANIDFSNKEICDSSCNEDCIINYWKFVVKFREEVHKLKDFIECNEMYFSLSQTVSFLKIETDLLKLASDAISIGTAPQNTPNTRAENVLKLFYEHDMNSFLDLKNEILDSFREKIGTLAV